jgi:phosphonate transport system substrate-binding protein
MKRRTTTFPLKALVISAVSCLAFGCSAATDGDGASPAVALRFSAIPDQNTTELAERFQPLADHISAELGVTVEYVPTRDYQATVEAFKNGDILLAWFGGLTGVQARAAVDGSRAIAQGDTDPEYYSYFIAHRDTGLERSEDFPEGIGSFTFTFGSESSTSGRLMPEFFIREATRQAPDEFFNGPVGFSGSHDRTAELVESGQYQVGALNYLVYERRVENGTTDPDVARIIWKTPTYVDYHWVAHPDLESEFGAGFTQRLQSALIEITDPSLLSALPRERLIPAADENYDQLRAVAEQLGMLR